MRASRPAARRGASRTGRPRARSSGAPSALSSFSADSGMYGVSSTVSTRRPSARLRRTVLSFSACSGSLASCHGAFSSTYRFRRRTRCQMRSSACVISAWSSSAQTSSTRPSKSRRELGVDVDRRHLAAAVAAEHVRRAAREVAELVGQLALVALAERDRGDAAVLAEGDLAEAVVAQRVGAEAVHHLERVEHVAERLAHLVLGAGRVLHQQVAVDVDLARELDAGRHQHRRPEDRVELQDVLADDVERAARTCRVRSSPSGANESAV